MGFHIRWEICQVVTRAFIACDIELSFVREIFYFSLVILMSFNMMKLDWEGYPENCLIDLVAEIVIVGYCS